jgi:hypothetical protein
VPLRILTALLAFAPLCCAAELPAFRWIREIGAPGSGELAGLGVDSQGNIYLAGITRSRDFPVQSAAQDHLAGGSDVFVTKLNPSGNIVYSTYLGGSGDETANAMTVDHAGNVYVVGITSSVDFPTTSGAYSPSVPPSTFVGGFVSFLFKLNPDGSVGYATYFTNSQTAPNAIAVDSAGSAYLTGLTYGGLAATHGAYRTTCACVPPSPPFSFAAHNDAFLTRFDSAGSRLLFSTYVGSPIIPGAIALAADGSAYIAGHGQAIYSFDATGSSLIASGAANLTAQAIALSPDGAVYLAGTADDPFRPTPGAFQPLSGLQPGASQLAGGQTVLVKMDAQLQNTLAATFFGGVYGNPPRALALDGGNVYVGGYTSPRSLPTRTPFVQGFGLGITGYVAELTGDLSTLLFSSEFGDNEPFAVNGLAIGAGGNVVLGGSTGLPSQSVWVNSGVLAPPASLRIDAVQNAETQLSDPLFPGETILIRGAGFAADTQLLIGGAPAASLSIAPTAITAVVPSGIAGAAATVQAVSGGDSSNAVTTAVANPTGAQPLSRPRD